MNNYAKYVEIRKAIVSLLDDVILSTELRADQVHQMLETLEHRYIGWSDGRVPEDTLENLVARWHDTGGDKLLHEFLRITEVQYRRWLERRIVRVAGETKVLKEDGT